MSAIIARTYSAWLLVLGPLAFVLGLGPWIDREYFPVVRPFVVINTSASTSPATITVDGWMTKRRDCRLLEIYAVSYADNGLSRITDIAFRDRSKPELISRPPQTQFWGPWEITAAPDTARITVRTLHRCHPLWDTAAEYTLWERDK